jgi:rhamnosyl/mannosyltransferase
MERSSVLHIYKDYYPPVVGGIEKHIHLLAEAQRERHDVRVLVANPNGTGTARERRGGIEIVRVRQFGRPGGTPFCPSFPLWMRRLRGDILHFQFPHPTGEFSYLLARPRGKVVVTYQCDIVRQSGLLRFYKPFLKMFLRRADVILPTSPPLIGSSPWLKPHAHKCIAVPMGVPLEQYARTPDLESRAAAIRAAHDRPIVLFVGQLRYYKGLHFLLQAMRDIEAHLIVVGEGREGQDLVRHVERLGIEEQVEFVGERTGDELLAYYFAADVFCLPSHLRAEAFSLAQVEAMACGLPVVSCAVGTGVEWVNRDGVTGYVVPPAMPEKISGALTRLLRNPKLRRELSRNALERAQKEFGLTLMLERLEIIYQWVLNPKGPMPRFLEGALS